MKILTSRFSRAATCAADEPQTPEPHVVLLGRSNVGKSSLINALLGVKSLARTSSAPGRTQAVHFYLINDRWYFVDLPGYGYAKVPEAVRRTWKPMIEGYLDRRAGSIVLALLVVDARRSPTDLDRTMREWLEAQDLHYVVAVTKTDQLGMGERVKAQRLLAAEYGAEALFVSARTGLGLRELWRHLDSALSPCVDAGHSIGASSLDG